MTEETTTHSFNVPGIFNNAITEAANNGSGEVTVNYSQFTQSARSRFSDALSSAGFTVTPSDETITISWYDNPANRGMFSRNFSNNYVNVYTAAQNQAKNVATQLQTYIDTNNVFGTDEMVQPSDLVAHRFTIDDHELEESLSNIGNYTLMNGFFRQQNIRFSVATDESGPFALISHSLTN